MRPPRPRKATKVSVTPDTKPPAGPAPPEDALQGIEVGPARTDLPILVADDDLVTRRLLSRTLTKFGHEVVEVEDGNSAWEILAADTQPRLAVLDWMMPGLDGPEICRQLRELRKFRNLRDEPYTYVILLTGRSEKADIVEGMSAGADDYLTKPFDENELAVRLRAGLRLLDMQSELVEALRQKELLAEQNRQQAMHDPLTGILNHGAIREVLESELNRGRRWNDPVAVVLADLDHFKCVNDRFGHLAGDETLRETSKRMRAALRDYDTVGRYGGEEFLVVLAGCWPQIARRIAERIRTVVAARPVSTSSGPIDVTASFGIGVCNWEHPIDSDSLINAADLALYRAKEAGRNRVVVAGYEDYVPPGETQLR
ncbi:MAG: diguanylate cyclase [Acidimicrobiia bacterium]|nr:diguanylate cyclase [Acidimicrobiia bacterium]